MALPILGLIGGVMVVSGFVQNALHFYPPLWTAWQKWAFSRHPNVNPAVAELVSMRWRDVISKTEYYQKCSEFGYNNNVADNLFKISETLLTMHDYIALWRRGELEEEEADNELRKMHLDDQAIVQAKQATLYFPSAPDLIRWAVREVYTPDILSKFGAMEDLPDKYLKEAGKAGLREEHAKNYWAAHWELPSPQMGFQMLHRRIIDENTLKLLLRALDVMPYWRDALVKLSYNPLTRVDVRRMYKLGVLNEEEVNDSYLDRGYSPENAVRMTEFTIAYESDELTGITRASVMSSYQKGIISSAQLETYLEAFGYPEGVVDFWMSIARYDKESDALEIVVNEIKQRYFTGMYTLDQARNELLKHDIPASYISEIILQLSIKQSQKLKVPSRSDLESWLKLNVINDAEYSKRMLKLGYLDGDIEKYLTEISKEVDTKKVVLLSQKTYERWYNKTIINESRFREIMITMKRSTRDIDNLVRELRPEPA